MRSSSWSFRRHPRRCPDNCRSRRRHLPGADDLAARVTGRHVAGVRRRGKYLWLDLGDDLGLLLHLGMSGQLLVEDADAPDEKHLHARFRFADGGRHVWTWQEGAGLEKRIIPESSPG